MIKQIGSNMTEVAAGGLSPDGAVVLYSYSTPVAARIGAELFRTEKKWSATTTRHINQWLADRPSEVRPQSWFDGLLTVQAQAVGGAE